MKRRKFSLPLLLGSCLILGSLCLVLVGQLRARAGAGESREVVAQMETLLPERTVGVPGTYPYADTVIYLIHMLWVGLFTFVFPVNNPILLFVIVVLASFGSACIAIKYKDAHIVRILVR